MGVQGWSGSGEQSPHRGKAPAGMGAQGCLQPLRVPMWKELHGEHKLFLLISLYSSSVHGMHAVCMETEIPGSSTRSWADAPVS